MAGDIHLMLIRLEASFLEKSWKWKREILDRGYRELVNYFAANSGGIGSSR